MNLPTLFLSIKSVRRNKKKKKNEQHEHLETEAILFLDLFRPTYYFFSEEIKSLQDTKNIFFSFNIDRYAVERDSESTRD